MWEGEMAVWDGEMVVWEGGGRRCTAVGSGGECAGGRAAERALRVDLGMSDGFFSEVV